MTLSEGDDFAALFPRVASLAAQALAGPAKLLVVPVVVMTALLLLSKLSRMVTPAVSAENPTAARRPSRQPRQYRLATSILDTEGNCIAPWQPTPRRSVHDGVTEDAGAATSESSGGGDRGSWGWFNLGLVMAILYIASNGVSNAFAVGSFWRDGGAYTGEVLRWLPELARDWAILAAVYFSFTLGYQYLVLVGWLRGNFAYAVQFLAESSMLAGCIAYAFQRSDWPTTQRMAWLLETVVLAMKMHSYIVVNRHLALEVAAGGPGTGAIIFQLERAEYAAYRTRAAALLHPPVSLNDELTEGIAAEAPSVPFIAEDAPSRPASAVPLQSPTNGSLRLRRRGSAASSLAPPPSPGAVAAHTSSPAPGAERSPRRSEVPRLFQVDAAQAEASSAFGTGGITFFPPIGEESSSREVLEEQEHARKSAGRSSPGPGLGSPGSNIRRRSAANRQVAELSTGSFAGSGVPAPAASVSAAAAVTDAAAATAADVPAGDGGGSSSSSFGPQQWAARHAEFARRLLGRAVYGLNFENELVSSTVTAYPANVSVVDFFLFSFAPVLTYDVSFPRTQRFRPGYFAEKALLSVGLLTVGLHIMTLYVLPVLDRIACMDEVEAVVQLMAPLISIMLLLFFLVFECVLNAFAELTLFGARSHYESWWNASTFLEWSRQWNLPVHNFLYTHVYLDLMRQYGFGADSALLCTFLVSIVLHEVVIWGILARVTVPWLGLFSLLQLPLGTIQRASFIKGKRLGNLILWLGLVVGVALITTLYAKEVSGPCVESTRV